MSHLTEEQLVLHYYGEEGETLIVERHLDECDECRALYGSLQRTLNSMDAMPVPERGAEYGEQVWRRIEAKLPPRRWWQTWMGGAPALRWAFSGAAMAALLTLAFLAGRYYPDHTATPQIARDTHAPGAGAAGRDGRLSRPLPDGAGRTGERQRQGPSRHFRRAGARARSDQRNAPLQADGGGDRQHVGHRNSGRARAGAARYRARSVAAFAGGAREVPRAPRSRRHFVQDPGGEFERAEPGRKRPGKNCKG